MAIKSFKRYEKKFMLTKEQYDQFIPKILEYMNPDEHCKNGQNYNIYNVYYDTDNDDVIRHSISKPYYKEKLRLRSYKIPTSLNDTVFLELKKKINGIVTKRRVVITLGEAYKFIETRERPKKVDFVTNQIFNELEYYLNNNKVYPKVYISYSRKAFFAIDNHDFRLTFDNCILTRRNKLSLEAGSFGSDLLGPSKYLMEVKILGAMPVWFSNILSELSIYNTHFSKYGNEFMNYCKEKNNIDRRQIVC